MGKQTVASSKKAIRDIERWIRSYIDQQMDGWIESNTKIEIRR